MAKITASGLAKSAEAGMWVRIYVVKDAEGLRAANRKDASKRYATTVTDVERVPDTRLYRITTSMGEVLAQGSQWFDVQDEEAPATPAVDTDVPAIEAPPTVEYPDDSGSYDLGYEHATRAGEETISRLRQENARLMERVHEAERRADDEGYSIVADQVGTIHAMIEGQDVMCESETRTLITIATNVRGELVRSRKVCVKCAEIVHNPESQNESAR